MRIGENVKGVKSIHFKKNENGHITAIQFYTKKGHDFLDKKIPYIENFHLDLDGNRLKELQDFKSHPSEPRNVFIELEGWDNTCKADIAQPGLYKNPDTLIIECKK